MRQAAGIVAFLTVVLAGFSTSPAWAQVIAPAEDLSGEDVDSENERPADRAVPDYDGRGEEPTTAGDVLLWVPRILFSPFYLVSEYVLRRPLGWLVTELETSDDASWLVDLFDFSKSSDFGVVPTAFVEFGFRANIGLYVFIENAPFRNNRFRIHAATGGRRYLKVTVVDRFPLSTSDGEGPVLAFRGHASRRQDYIYAGLGPDSRTADEGRYQSDQLEVGAQLDIPFWRESHLHADFGIERAVYGQGGCCGEPSVRQQAADGVFELPPGIDEDFSAYYQSATLALDSRGTGPEPNAGFRLELDGEHAVDVEQLLERRWIRYGTTAGAFFSVAPGRTVGILGGVHFVDSLGSEPVPFSKLDILGGEGLFRGFNQGRLHGTSSLAFAFEYRWPIWVWLDGHIQIATGNVFGDRLAGATLGRFRTSAAFGLRTSGSPDHAFQFLIATGTETVDQGFSLTSFRLLIGTTEGF